MIIEENYDYATNLPPCIRAVLFRNFIVGFSGTHFSLGKDETGQRQRRPSNCQGNISQWNIAKEFPARNWRLGRSTRNNPEILEGIKCVSFSKCCSYCHAPSSQGVLVGVCVWVLLPVQCLFVWYVLNCFYRTSKV